MANEITLSFEDAFIDARGYNGMNPIDAHKMIDEQFRMWYPEFELVMIDWVKHTIKVLHHA
jgi:hypothetical protein